MQYSRISTSCLISHFSLLSSFLYFHNHKRLELYKRVDFASSKSHIFDDFFQVTNSENWLYSDRLANIEDPLLDPKTVYDLISYNNLLRFAPLDVTMCSKRSHFLGGRTRSNTIGDNFGLSVLAFRLLFLSIHHHQHHHALREVQMRHGSGINEVIHDAKLRGRIFSQNFTLPGVFDFECPDAKFLVGALPGGSGLGHEIRKMAVETMKAAMASNRVALFVNSARSGPKETRSHWTMASCERRDFQCFFMPLSPCTITEQDLQMASVLTMEESRTWGRSKDLQDRYKTSKVVVMKIHQITNHMWFWRARNVQMMRSIISFVNTASAALNDDDMKALGFDNASLALVKSYLASSEKEDPWIFDHALTFYILRPNPMSKHKIEGVTQQVFPSDFDSSLAIGLPIRSSDKCFRESECLTFDRYMQIVRNASLRNGSFPSWLKKEGKRRHIILTSESKEILQARHRYNADENFPFTLIANDNDVAQGTGNPMYYEQMASRNITADDIMLSTMSSISMQLMATWTVGNCCSNFHKLMLDFLSRGCGAAQKNYFECLQDNENPEFRLCCQWSTNHECKRMKFARQTAVRN